ncbi:hypothetical protein Hanom_Chr14g01266371 [Helianthus anomalus]
MHLRNVAVFAPFKLRFFAVKCSLYKKSVKNGPGEMSARKPIHLLRDIGVYRRYYCWLR